MKYVIEDNFPFEEIDPIAEVESYRKEINRPIYHIHKWWAKRLGSVFRAIVSGSLTKEHWPDFHSRQKLVSKVVLDPFMGSGTTLGEAAKLGASVVGCDVNPVSTFLVTQALKNVEVEILEQEFEAIQSDVMDTIKSYYVTKNPYTSLPIPALYYFWVTVVTLPTGEELPLFSSYVFSKNAYPKKKPEAKLYCPSCESIFTDNYNSTKSICPNCSHVYNPQQGPAKGAKVTDKYGNEYKIKDLILATNKAPKHKLYAIMALDENEKKIYIKPTKFDFDLLRKVKKDFENLKPNLPLPTMSVRSGHNTSQALGYNYNYWSDFFNERQLLCLGILLKRILEIEDPDIKDHFVILFSGTLEFNNLFCSFKGEGTGAVRHMFSNHILKPERTPLENSVWGIKGKSSGTFSSLFKSRLIKAKTYLDEPFEIKIEERDGKKINTKVVCSDPINLRSCSSWDELIEECNSSLILNGDSSVLPIPNNSIDAIITDPPYFDFVHYSELSDFFYAWLSVALKDRHLYLNREDSSHSNEVQDKEPDNFSEKISSIFKECHRVLKNDSVMCFSYHHSSITGWLAIYKALINADFEIVSAHPVKAEMSVATPKSLAKSPINIDAILVCKKRSLSNSICNEGVQEIIEKVEVYKKRFVNAGRTLSAGDEFVLYCSQAISLASRTKMKPKAVTALLEEVVKLIKL